LLCNAVGSTRAARKQREQKSYDLEVHLLPLIKLPNSIKIATQFTLGKQQRLLTHVITGLLNEWIEADGSRRC